MKGLTNVMNKQEGSSLPVGIIIKCSQSPGEDWAECNGELIDAASCDADLPMIPTSYETILGDGPLLFDIVYQHSGNNGVFSFISDRNSKLYIYSESTQKFITVSDSYYTGTCVCHGFVYATYNDNIYQINKSSGAKTSRASGLTSKGHIFNIDKDYIIHLAYLSGTTYATLFKVSTSTGALTQICTRSLTGNYLPNGNNWGIYENKLYAWDNNSHMYIYEYNQFNPKVIQWNSVTINAGIYYNIVNGMLFNDYGEYINLNTGQFQSPLRRGEYSYKLQYDSDMFINGVLYGITQDNSGNTVGILKQIGTEKIIKSPLTMELNKNIYDCGNNLMFYNNNYYITKLTQFTKKLLPYKPGHWIKIR